MPFRSIRENFRRWWQVPRRASDREDERVVTFLELFYDLVYVVIIAELAHALAQHPDLNGIGAFVFLFVIVWWAWSNGATYHDLHGNNDVRTRVFTFLQMFAVATMAVFAHNAMGEGAVGFALSYSAFQLILTFLWWRTGVHDIDHRPLSTPYVAAFLVSTLLFTVSVFVPPPWRFVLWGIGVVITLVRSLKTAKYLRSQRQDGAGFESFLTPSGVERFGLFTIIVLGEMIVGVVQGVAAHHQWSWLIGATATALACIALLMVLVQIPQTHRRLLRRGSAVAFVCAGLIALLGFSSVDTLPLLAVLALLLLIPIVYGFQFWVKRLATEHD